MGSKHPGVQHFQESTLQGVKIQNVKSTMHNANSQCIIYNAQCTKQKSIEHIARCTMHSAQCAVLNAQFAIQKVQFINHK